jgi:alpha-mannosidase
MLDDFVATLPQAPGQLSLFNSLGDAWRGCLPISAGPSCPAQVEPDGTTVSLVTVPPLAFATFERNTTAPATITLAEPVLENSLIRCRFDNNGTLISCFDKQLGREMLPPGGSGNRLALYVDRPVEWDAWDIDYFYQQERIATATATAPWCGWAGAARSVLEFTLAIGGSVITQRCILEEGARRVDFETVVQWSERHRMLRVGFDADVRDAIGRCEIQHGFLDRPTHRNTPYERAQFEVACHRYACMLDRDGGAAVLNDSKYGVHLQGTLIELALLRGTTYPDHAADEGEHRFTYSYLPFTGDFAQSGVVAGAARLNARPLLIEDHDAGGLSPLFALSGPGISVEAVKRPESGQGIIVRLVETLGRRATCKFTPSGPNPVIAATDLLERPLPEVLTDSIPFRPFQLRTLHMHGGIQPQPGSVSHFQHHRL